MASQSRSYPKPSGLEASQLVEAIEKWIRPQKFRTQVLVTAGGGLLIQIEKLGGWRKLTGMSTALNVVVTPSGDNFFNVEIGAGRWLDKVVGGAVGLVLLWPFLVTTVVGSVQQAKMPRRIFTFIERYLKDYQRDYDEDQVTIPLVSAVSSDEVNPPVAMCVAPSTPPGNNDADNVISQLERLASLKERGILTEEEFVSQKASILGSKEETT